jgi:hypothetical protein
MLYRALADLLVVLHLAFVLFVVLGGFLVHWRRRLAWLHIPVAAWGALIEFRGWICPLTPWEQHLRQRAGEAGYTGGFIEHYLLPVLYPAGLSPGIQRTLGMFVVGINAVAYGTLLWAHRRARTDRHRSRQGP